MFGFGKSKPSSVESDLALNRTQHIAAKLLIQENRKKLNASMEAMQKSQQFYYVGIAYTAGTMITFSVSMMAIRQRVPIIQKVPWLLFTVTGYLLGGQIWNLHQAWFARNCALAIEGLKTEMTDLHAKFPHLSEYRAEVSALEKIRRDLGIVSQSEAVAAVSNAVSGGHVGHSGGVKTAESDMDDMLSQIMSRNKTLNKVAN